MNVAIALLRAEHIGIRELRENLSRVLKRERPTIVTDNGEPQNVILPYEEMVEIIDILDELQDRGLVKIVQEGKKAVKKGAKGRLASKLFSKIRAKK